MAKTEYKRLTLDIPPALHRELKQAALDQQTSVRALLMSCAEKIVGTDYKRSPTSAAETLTENGDPEG